MRKLLQGIAIATALGLAAPVVAGDTRDTAIEKKHATKKKARSAKRSLTGRDTASDRAEDAKDTAHESAAKGRKGARKAARRVKAAVEPRNHTDTDR